MRIAPIALAACLGFFAPLLAAADQLTVEDLIAAHPVTGDRPGDFTWAPDGSRYLYATPGAKEKDPPVLHVYDVHAKSDHLIASAKSDSRGSRSRAIAQIVWSHDSRHIAFLNGSVLQIADAGGGHERILARDADDPQWSPDDTRIAYVRANDLDVVNVQSGLSKRITFDGSERRINGDPDWLYSEELEVGHAYAWSPRGDGIAYLSFDESWVAPFPIQDYAAPLNQVEQQRYPLAGSKNARVQLRTVSLTSGISRTLYDSAKNDEYIVPFAYAPDGSVYAGILDRVQQHFRLLRFAADAAGVAVIRESDPAFLEPPAAPYFIDHGRALLWISGRDGVRALYRVDTQSGAAKRLSGTYPIASVLRVDEKSDAVDVAALYPRPTERAALRLALDGRGTMRDLTPEAGVHEVVMPERGDVFIDKFSALNTPPRYARRSVDGVRNETIFATPSLARFALGEAKAIVIPSGAGPLDAVLVEPAGFDPAKKYPIVVETYGGPLPVNPGEAADAWNIRDRLFVQHGYLMLHLDGPASRFVHSSDQRRFRGHLGEAALLGPQAAVAWLKRQSYVDVTRLGLTGWSFGGYLTAFTLTHAPGLFRTGLAGAPVTDWRFYDTAYTERYMGLPKANEAAYDRNSVLPALGKLRAKLLVIHGSSDDNVHLTNSMQLISASIKAEKPVNYFIFPGARHGPTGVAALRALYHLYLDWWERTL